MNVTVGEAKRIVLAAVVITGVLTALGEVTRKQMPGPRLAIAGAIIGVTLAASAEVAPQLAAASALLMASTAVLTEGSPAIQALSRFTGRPDIYPTPPPAAPGTNVSLP